MSAGDGVGGDDRVTRGGEKLEGAVRDLKVDFRGKDVLDIGSSTGGFTEVALRHGARRVVAVEKGTGQMRGELARDGRVELFEKTDIFSVRLIFFRYGWRVVLGKALSLELLMCGGRLI